MPTPDRLYELLKEALGYTALGGFAGQENQPDLPPISEYGSIYDLIGTAGAGGAATTGRTGRGKKKGTKAKASKKKAKVSKKKAQTRKKTPTRRRKGSTPRVAGSATPTVGSTTVGASTPRVNTPPWWTPPAQAQAAKGWDQVESARQAQQAQQAAQPPPTRTQQARSYISGFENRYNPLAPGLTRGQRTVRGGKILGPLAGLAFLANMYRDDEAPIEDVEPVPSPEAIAMANMGAPGGGPANVGRSGLQALLRTAYTSVQPVIDNPMGDWETDHAELLELLMPDSSYTDRAAEALLEADDARKEALAQQQKSKPEAPEFDKSERMRAFFGGMAAAVAGIEPDESGYNIAQIFAAAGGGGHAALEEQDRYQEDEMSEYQSELSDFYQNVATFQATMAADKARNDLALVKVMQQQAIDETNTTINAFRLSKPQIIQDPKSGDVLLIDPTTGRQKHIPSMHNAAIVAAGGLPASASSITLPNGKPYPYDANNIDSMMRTSQVISKMGGWGNMGKGIEVEAIKRAKVFFFQKFPTMDDSEFNAIITNPVHKFAEIWEREVDISRNRIIAEHYLKGTPVARFMAYRLGNASGQAQALWALGVAPTANPATIVPGTTP